MFHALVLTAGLGSRLDPVTRLVAKPAVPLGGRTLVERVLAWLQSQGVTDAVLNLHHLPATVTGVVGDGVHLGMRVRYSWEDPILGSAGGPRHALPLIDGDPFLIVNGDTLCNVDIGAMASAHAANGALVTMAVVPNPAPGHYNGLAVRGDRVVGVIPRGSSEKSWHFVGIQIASASVFATVPDGQPAESVHGIYRPLMTEAGAIAAYRVAAAFHDVGTPRDYLTAALSIADGATIEPGAVVGQGARVTRTIVWPGATIGDEAVLHECIVTGVEIPAGFRADRAVIVPAGALRDTDTARRLGDLGIFGL
ncbi:MAG TPA: NDP-sugar synthase [Vicinamibacterales bacterium]|nr:NDP-sugar synthase [Vicinamibacterales bacterium]